MAGTYWGSQYWSSQYWGSDYWTEDTTGGGGRYWSARYWGADYWGNQYWSLGDTGTVFQSQAGVRTLSEFNPVVQTGIEAQPSTPARTLSGLAAAVSNTVTVVPATQTRILGSFAPVIDTGGYVEGDISFTVFPSSGFAFTDGVEVTLPTRTLTGAQHGIEESGGEVVNVQQTPTRTLTEFPVSASNPVSIDLVTLTKTLTSFNTAAGSGTVISATAPGKSLARIGPSVSGTPNVNDVEVGNLPSRTLSPIDPSVLGTNVLIKPPDTVTQNPGIVNNDAAPYPSFYEICQRTGMRVKRGTLIRDGYGHWVRPESADMRHPQEFVRSVRESTKKGSPNQETAQDRFIGSDVAEVTADSL